MTTHNFACLYKNANTVGEIADVFETEHEGKQAFLIVTEQSVPKEDTVLKPTEEVLKPCADLAWPSAEIIPKISIIPRNGQRQRQARKAPQKALLSILG